MKIFFGLVVLAMIVILLVLVPVAWVWFKINDYLYEKKMKQGKEHKNL